MEVTGRGDPALYSRKLFCKRFAESFLINFSAKRFVAHRVFNLNYEVFVIEVLQERRLSLIDCSMPFVARLKAIRKRTSGIKWTNINAYVFTVSLLEFFL